MLIKTPVTPINALSLSIDSLFCARASGGWSGSSSVKKGQYGLKILPFIITMIRKVT